LPSSEQTDRLAATLRGFGPLGLLAIAIIIIAGATLNSAVAQMIYWDVESKVAHLVFK
jgi:hypothetical protein